MSPFLSPQIASRAPIEIDRIIARKHKGRSASGNLAVACIYWRSQRWSLHCQGFRLYSAHHSRHTVDSQKKFSAKRCLSNSIGPQIGRTEFTALCSDIDR
jgi:hypothetical protein